MSFPMISIHWWDSRHSFLRIHLRCIEPGYQKWSSSRETLARTSMLPVYKITPTTHLASVVDENEIPIICKLWHPKVLVRFRGRLLQKKEVKCWDWNKILVYVSYTIRGHAIILSTLHCDLLSSHRSIESLRGPRLHIPMPAFNEEMHVLSLLSLLLLYLRIYL